MATADDRETSYGGGAGGKFRKRPHRRTQLTPYDRPLSTIVRNPRSEGWLSKLVDPASKFISAGAFKFFSNFRKRLTEPEQIPRDGRQEAVPNSTNCNGPSEQDIDRSINVINSSYAGGISELEQMLKQRTFTRSEIDRLTELLHSRTVEFPVGNDKINEGNHLTSVSDLEKKHGFTRSPLQENRNEIVKYEKNIPTSGSNSRILEEDVASPAELAKAYMGSRPSKISPSMLGVRSKALKEEMPLVNYGLLPSKSSALSLASKTEQIIGVPPKGLMTPRSHGRSAIYNMARTPYSRGPGSTKYTYGSPSSSSLSAGEQNRQFLSKQSALKRNSDVLDGDIGSIGAIRRTRQKSNLSYHVSSLSTRGTGVNYSVDQHYASLMEKPLLNDAQKKVSKDGEEIGDDSIVSTKYSLVPSPSTQMASKILQHLEKFNPKDKSSESKLVAKMGGSPIKLTPNMLHGQALRSLEDSDSMKTLQKIDSHKLVDSSNALLQDMRGETSQKKNKVEENGFKELEVPLHLSTSLVSGNAAVSMKNNVPYNKNADTVILESATQPPEKKQAFRMSAQEDFLEIDDEIIANGLQSTPLHEWREASKASGKAVLAEVITPERRQTPENRVPVENSTSKNATDLEFSDSLVPADNDKTGFYSPTSMIPSSTVQQDMSSQLSSVDNKFIPSKDPNPSIPVVHKAFSSLSSAAHSSEAAVLNSVSWSDLKQEKSDSLANDVKLKVLESDKGDEKNKQKAEYITGTSECSAAVVSTSATNSGFLPSTLSVKDSNLNNESLASSPFKFSSAIPTPASSKLTQQILGNGSTGLASFSSACTATFASTSTSTSILNISSSMTAAASPSFPASAGALTTGPIFTFGSSLTSSQATLSSATGAGTTELMSNTEKETSFGNLNKPAFGGASYSAASSGSNLFGFNSSVASIGNGQSQGSLPRSEGLSVVSSQAPSSTGAAIVTQSMPFQFGVSGSSPVFGTSGTTSFTSASSVISSSVSAAKPFGSGSGTTFTLGSSPSSDANTASSTIGGTSSIFSSSWQTSKSPVIGSAASSPSPSTGFTFGVSSTSAGATSSVPMVFGSGAMFSFTSATATTSSLPSLSQSQPLFGSTTAVRPVGNGGDQMSMEDSMAEDPVHASAPTVPVFGQTSVPPSPPAFMFGSTPMPLQSPSPFQFGGQQSIATPQNSAPFQASSSLDFSGGGSFSLGSGGGDKSARKVVRISRNRNRKK